MSGSTSTAVVAREARSKDPGKVVDVATRDRRIQKTIQDLEQDNFQEEPHADLVMSKKAPKFQETLEPPPSEKGGPRKKRSRPSEFYKKYRKSFAQLLEEDLVARGSRFNYLSAQADPPDYPVRHFCNVCGLPSTYTCPQCGVRYCCTKCFKTHQETRCLKWTA